MNIYNVDRISLSKFSVDQLGAKGTLHLENGEMVEISLLENSAKKNALVMKLVTLASGTELFSQQLNGDKTEKDKIILDNHEKISHISQNTISLSGELSNSVHKVEILRQQSQSLTQENIHPKSVNGFFYATDRLYEAHLSREIDGMLSLSLNHTSAALRKTFTAKEENIISRIVGEKFQELSEMARAYAEGQQVAKGARRYHFSLQDEQSGAARCYSIKCRQLKDGTFSLEASKLIGQGFSKLISKVVLIEHQTITSGLVMKAQPLPGPLSVAAKKPRSESLKKELETMRLFNNEPEFVHCYSVIEKTYKEKTELANLVKGGFIEECDGGSLEQLTFAPCPPEDESTRLRYALSVAKGLAKMHHKGICHRDVKPSNVLLKSEGEQFDAKVGDLGSSSFIGEKCTLSDLAYLAPEFFVDSRAATSQDVWSFGLTLLELTKGFQVNPLQEVVRTLSPPAPQTPGIEDCPKTPEVAPQSPQSLGEAEEGVDTNISENSFSSKTEENSSDSLSSENYGAYLSTEDFSASLNSTPSLEQETKRPKTPVLFGFSREKIKIIEQGYREIEKISQELLASPREVDRLIARMLAVDPQKRPQMHEVAMEISRIIEMA